MIMFTFTKFACCLRSAVCTGVGALDRNVLIQCCIISSDISDLISFDTCSLFTEIRLLARSNCSTWPFAL